MSDIDTNANYPMSGSGSSDSFSGDLSIRITKSDSEDREKPKVFQARKSSEAPVGQRVSLANNNNDNKGASNHEGRHTVRPTKRLAVCSEAELDVKSVANSIAESEIESRPRVESAAGLMVQSAFKSAVTATSQAPRREPHLASNGRPSRLLAPHFEAQGGGGNDGRNHDEKHKDLVSHLMRLQLFQKSDRRSEIVLHL